MNLTGSALEENRAKLIEEVSCLLKCLEVCK